MFPIATKVSVLILACLALLVALKLAMALDSEGKLLLAANLPIKSKPFVQTRVNMRRDIYGEYEQIPYHLTLFCSDADLSYNRQTSSLQEHMNQVEAFLDRPGEKISFNADVVSADSREASVKASFFSAHRATKNGAEMQLKADYGQLWQKPSGLQLSIKQVDAQDLKKGTALTCSSAAYDGKNLQADEAVKISSPRGLLNADHISYDPAQDSGLVSGNLAVHLLTGSSLLADRCLFDRAKNRAEFTAKRKVAYYHPAFEAHKPLSLECDKMTIACVEDSDGRVSDQLTAEGEVEAVYDDQWELSAEKATYLAAKDEPQKNLLVEAAKDQGCTLTSPWGDYLVAQTIASDLTEQCVSFEALRGELRDGQTTLSSDRAHWNHGQLILNCSEQTKIGHIERGTFLAEGELQAFFDQTASDLQLTALNHSGKLKVNSLKDGRNILCQGLVLLDHERRTLIMEGSEEHPILYTAPMGELQADQLQVTYLWQSDAMQLQRLCAEGHIKLQRTEQGETQVALADTLEQQCSVDRTTLTALSPRRVVFYDPTRKVTASAKGVEIYKDPKTGKFTMNGQGDVRFKLMEAELRAMRQYLQRLEDGRN